MSEYIVSARKFRPDTFKSVVGQEALTTTLKNAIVSGKLAHAYLFCGPRGVGKTSCARIFAKTINCSNRTPEGEACNSCESCLSFNEQRSYNVHELDAASNNTVDDIRNLIEQVQISPMTGHYKVYIIDEVHMLSMQAFNAFLKTLEEPPAHAVFVLATTDKHKVLPTIISRCQTYDFNRISVHDITEHLKYVANTEGIEAEEEALQRIAINADGGMRDALSIFDQIAGYGQGHITLKHVLDNLSLLDESEFFKILAFVIMGDHTRLMLQVDALVRKGFSALNIMQGFSTFLRNVLLAQDERTLSMIETTDNIRSRYIKAGQTCKPSLIWKCLKLSTDYEKEYKQCASKRLLLEVTLLSMCEMIASSSLNAPIATAAPSTGEPRPVYQATAPQAPPPMPSTSSQHRQEVQTVGTFEVKRKVPTNKPASSRLMERFSVSLTKDKHKAEVKHDTPKRNTPFDDDQLQAAWRAHQAGLTKQALLKQTMHDCLPIVLDGHRIIVRVYSPQQADQIRSIEADLMVSLADKLKNDMITLTVEYVKDDTEHKSLPITPKDKQAYFEERNEWFGKLTTDLDLKPVS